jgi:uncharacterized protein (TIRG00374 family)
VNESLKSSLVFFLKLLVTLIPAYFVYLNISKTPGIAFTNVYHLFSNAKIWFLILAFLSLGISNLTGCFQWKILLENQGVQLRYGHLLKLYFVGLFFNNFMPGNVGGDLKKIYDIRIDSKQDTIGAGFTATIFDRLFGLFFLNALALGVGALFFIHDPEHRVFLLPSLWVFIGFTLFLATLFSKRLGKILFRLSSWMLPSKIQERFSRMQSRFHYFRKTPLWISIIALSAITQTLRVLVHFFCGLAIGVDIAVSWYFFYIPMIAVISALPISIGGFGPRELLAQSLFAKAGVPGLESVLIQLLAYFISLILSLFGAVFFLNHKKPLKTPH